MPEHFEIRIRKEALKFASSHMTVFPDGTKESLHGHQYLPQVSLRFTRAEFKEFLPFSRIKSAMRKIAALWDEKVLVATRNPHYREVRAEGTEVEFFLCEKRYVLPADEVVFLKVDNITCENLAWAYSEFIRAELEEDLNRDGMLAISVLIEESPGQGAGFTYEKDP